MPQNNTPIRSVLSRKKSSEIFSTSAERSVSHAVELMNRHGIGSLLVLQDDRLVGIFTERDVLTRVVAQSRNPSTTTISEVMTADPQFLSSEDTVSVAMERMTEKRARHLPVLGDDNKIIGLVSIGDVTRFLLEENLAEAEHLKSYVFGEYTA